MRRRYPCNPRLCLSTTLWRKVRRCRWWRKKGNLPAIKGHHHTEEKGGGGGGALAIHSGYHPQQIVSGVGSGGGKLTKQLYFSLKIKVMQELCKLELN